jgi:hypothetical protein
MEQVVKNTLVKLLRRCGQFLLTVQSEIGFPQLFISLYWNRDLERGLLEYFFSYGARVRRGGQGRRSVGRVRRRQFRVGRLFLF